MIVAVVKDLATRFTKPELEEAITAFEATRENKLNVEGKDDGEKLSNLLAASHIRARMDKGMPLNEALREHSQRMRAVLTPGGAFGPKKTSG